MAAHAEDWLDPDPGSPDATEIARQGPQIVHARRVLVAGDRPVFGEEVPLYYAHRPAGGTIQTRRSVHVRA